MFSKLFSKLTHKKVKQTQTTEVKKTPKEQKPEAKVPKAKIPETKVQDQTPAATHVTFGELPKVVHKHRIEIPPRSSSLHHSGMPIQDRYPPNRKEKYPAGLSVPMMTPIIPPRSSSRAALQASRTHVPDRKSRWSSKTTHTFRDRSSGTITRCAIPLDEEAPPRAHRPGAPHAPGSTIFTTHVLSTIAGKEEWISRTTFTLADGTTGNQCSSSMPLEFFPDDVVNQTPPPPRGPTQPLPAAQGPARLEKTTRRRVNPFDSHTRPSARTSAAPRSPGHGGARPADNGPGRDAKPQGPPAGPPKAGQPRLRRTPAFHQSPEQFPYIVARPCDDSVPSLPIKHKQH